MNRFDEIKCKARDIASNVHADPEMRDAMADALVELIGLMVQCVGNAVAIEGESSMNDPFYHDPEETPEEEAERRTSFETEQDKAHNRYLIGESIQDEARRTVESVKNSDVERYHRITPGSSCRCGHVKSVHEAGMCTGEIYNREPCKGGPCTDYVAYGGEPVWTHTDRRPAMLRGMDERTGCPNECCYPDAYGGRPESCSNECCY